MFTVYPEPAESSAAPNFAIRASYPEPARSGRVGTLQVCTGWTLERVLDRFRSIGRHDAVARLAQELAAGLAVTIEMGRRELILWNGA